jgi:hypothetical protein
MRKISLWGKHHPWSARIIIIVSTFIISAIAFYLGENTRNNGYTMSSYLFVIICVFYFSTLLAYPNRRKSNTQLKSASHYGYRKYSDFILAACSFGIFFYAGNDPSKLANLPRGLYAASPLAGIKDPVPYKSLPAFYKSLRDENGKLLKWKERRKLLKQQLKGIKHSDEMSQGAKVLLTILCVLVAIGLLYLVAALACSLSCNGSGAAAVLVAIGGTALIVFLFVLAMRGIHRSRTQHKKIAFDPSS